MTVSSTTKIIIGKKGYPSGLFSLLPNIQPSSRINEPSAGVTSVRITIQRNAGRLHVVQVYFIYICFYS